MVASCLCTLWYLTNAQTMVTKSGRPICRAGNQHSQRCVFGWLVVALVLVAALVTTPVAVLASTVADSERPNIVLIVVDDMGFSDFGAFGGEIRTPHIDALAASGMRFSNFHVASSCAPTRAMLLTGVDNHTAGVGSMRELMPLAHRGKPGYEGVLNDRVQTFATLLQAVGYRTLVAGKWHLGVEPNNLPPARGFDYSVIQADSGADNFEMRPYLPMQAEARWYENGGRLASLPEDFYSSRFFVDKTIAHLQATSTEQAPFFAYVAFQANHTPIQAPASFIDAYRGEYLEGWTAIRNARVQRLTEQGIIESGATLAPAIPPEQWQALSSEQQYFEARRMQAYAGMATAMDFEIGRLVKYLQESGQHDNTVYVVFSDNGAVANEPYENDFGRRWLEKHYHREVETLGHKGSWVSAGRYWGRVSNTPLSGLKFTAGEGGLRVPLIIASGDDVAGVTQPVGSAPDNLTDNTADNVSHAFTHVTDIAPTLLALAGVTPDNAFQALQGKSLLPLLSSPAETVHAADEPIGFEFSGNAALYRGSFKLVRNFPPAGDNQWRLYDLAKDPGETNDLSGRLWALYEAMQADYAAYVEQTGVLAMPEDYELARQVMINTVLFNYLPRYLPYIGVFILLLAAGYIFRRRLQAASARKTSSGA